MNPHEPFQHKKSLGQNFLNSDYVPKKMCDAAGLSDEFAPPPLLSEERLGVDKSDSQGVAARSVSNDYGRVGLAGAAKERMSRLHSRSRKTVLEIGPGTGALTQELLRRGAHVVAVEADTRAIDTLKRRFQKEIENGQLLIHHKDARELFPSEFGLHPHQYQVVANIPYYLSGLLLRQLLDTEYQPQSLVLLIQKELAERIARAEKESLLSLSVKAFGDPSYICTIKRSHFTPPPNVDSAILAVRNISHALVGRALEPQFFQLLHLGFRQKRKQLMSNFAPQFDRETLAREFQVAGIAPNIRAEDMTLEQWVTLATRLPSISQ